MEKQKKIRKYLVKGAALLARDPARFLHHVKSEASFLFPGLLKGWAPWPTSVHITINSVCNLKCKTCDMGQRQVESPLYKKMASQREIGLEDWKKIIDKITFFDPVVIVDTVEPLLYKDIIGFLSYVRKEKGLRCIMTTNGLLLEKYADALAGIGLEKLNVSLDGIGRDHDAIRGVDGVFDKAVAGIKKLRAIDGHPPVGIHYTISDMNYLNMKDTIDRLAQMGCWDSFLFIHTSYVSPEMADRHNRRFRGYGVSAIDYSGIDLGAIDIGKLAAQIRGIKEAYKGKAVNFHPDIPEERLHAYYKTDDFISKDRFCKVPWRCTNILSNGDVIPLNRCGKDKFGNLLSADFPSIWNGKDYREFRLMLRKENGFPICARCGGLESL
jgi:MoaA/NifB/PqqE/SkfB family radical SAM enzyme